MNTQTTLSDTDTEEQARLFADWFADHADELNEQNEEHAKATVGKNAAYAAKHRAKRLHALPAWTDQKAVERIYVEAARTGMHVDHIYPLRGETVCGLHTEGNLRLLCPVANRKKGNRLTPEEHPCTDVSY